MNANPFTLGHQYLARAASEACDVGACVRGRARTCPCSPTPTASGWSRLGIHGIANITLHPGSPYIISRATFPDYFLKDKELAGVACMAIDLTLFRDHIAPALGITDRFVGTEPYCPTTGRYNQMMLRCLAAPATARRA